MAFETRALRVQIPCHTVTLIEPDVYDAEKAARHALAGLFGAGPVAGGCAGGCSNDCSSVTDRCIGRSERQDFVEIKHCAGSEELTRVLVVDATVLPALQEQLERHLREVQNAQRAVSEHLAKQEG